MKIISLTVVVLLLSAFVVFAADSSGFKRPQQVIIHNLPTGSRNLPISTEEPYISRDSQYLYFNTGSKEGRKDLHYAVPRGNQWEYGGEVEGVNTPTEVQGTVTLDNQGNIYYVDTRADHMLRYGVLDKTAVSVNQIRDFTAAPKRRPELFRSRIHGNMDIEVSPDGSMAFISRATWGWDGRQVKYIQASNLLYTLRRKDVFHFDLKESKRILQNINSGDLEYAAAISTDGLELFFTRLYTHDLNTLNLQSRIMRATRSSKEEPFGKPNMVESIGDTQFVEGPALSADGRTLYYHQKLGKKFRIFKVTR